MLPYYALFTATLLLLASLAAPWMTCCTAAAAPAAALPAYFSGDTRPANCQPFLPPFSSSEGPVRRIIVDDLTPFLQQTLQQHGIQLLLVLPGPSSDSIQARQDSSAMKIDWQKLTGVQRVDWVYSFHDFTAKWHSYLRHLNHHPSPSSSSSSSSSSSNGGSSSGGLPTGLVQKDSAADGTRALSVTTASTSSSSTTLEQHAARKALAVHVAVLVQGYNGRLGLQQLNVAAAISRRLRHAHSLSLSYSTHSDKADSIVVSTSEAEPLGAAFLSTSVFRDAFSKIYDNKLWGEAGGGSGHGSDLAWTAVIRQQLPEIITRYNITSMLDSSCGSMHWMSGVWRNVTDAKPGFKFMGTDVVCGLINRHIVSYANRTKYQFQCVDYASQRLPQGYDLVFSRDSLQHIPMHGVWQFLNNVKASGARYLLVGSYVKHQGPNADIKAGEYYPVDLLKPPFSLSPPLEVVDEQTTDGKHMLLFDVRKMTWEDPLLGLL